MRLRHKILLSRALIAVIPGSADIELVHKLLSKVIKISSKGCWLTNHDTTKYGSLVVNGKQIRAHRLSYELLKGKPLYHQSCHHCDVPACINPDHLFDGTQADNMKDAMRKGRLPWSKKC